ncbi:hypothetical protein FIM47_04580 [Helicobacter pylori]|nr:hypothetical protein FIM47_04580 [Helicobacter pylori]
MQTLKNKSFRVSIQWNALVRKPLVYQGVLLIFLDPLRFLETTFCINIFDSMLCIFPRQAVISCRKCIG